MVAETGTSIGQVSQTWAIRPISNSQSFHAIKDIMRSPSPPVDGTIRLGRKFNSHSISRRVSSPKPFKSKKSSFKWVKGELLGKGSYGQVYLALNATTGEIMAVKQVQLPQKSNKMHQPCHLVEALKFESDTLKDLDHPNIVAYLGFEENPEFLSIFLEYVPGGTIGGCLHEQGRFREEVTKSFASQILKGLEYLHSKEILHRDLKADNILLEPGGICKISDFGISKKVETINRGRAFTGMKGTVFWMAPETFDSRKQGYDVKVDIWSTGCVVLEMWTGKRPWSGEPHLPVMMKLWKDKMPPPLPADLILSEAAQDFRQECFQADPQRRPSAASLQNHSYLTLPEDWTFNFSEMGYHPSISRTTISRTTSNASQKSLLTLRLHQTKRKSHRPDTVTSHQRPSLVSSYSHTRIYLHRPIERESIVQNVNQDPLMQPEGPPVVVIKPLKATKSHVSKDHQARKSSLDICEIPIRKSRLIISNPDPDTDTDEDVKNPSTAYVYVPPPLPKIDTQMPYTPSVLTIQTKPISPPNSAMRSHPHSPSTSTILRSQIKKHLPKTHSSSLNHSTSNSPSLDLQHSPTSNLVRSDSGIHAWTYEHKLMDEIAIKRVIRVPSLLAVPRPSHATEWSSAETNVGPRPIVEDVVEHLQDFFPDYDLDQTVENSALNEPLNKRLTIRKVAEQQVKTSLSTSTNRRRTMLWDSHLEELKTSKKENGGQNAYFWFGTPSP